MPRWRCSSWSSGFKNYVRLQRVMWVAILRRVRDDAVRPGHRRRRPTCRQARRLLGRHRRLGDVHRRCDRGRARPPGSTSTRHSASSRPCSSRRSPGRRSNGRPTAASRTARSRAPARSATRSSSSSARWSLTGLLLALLAFVLENTRRHGVPVRRRLGLLERRRRGDAGRLLPVAEHHRHGHRQQPDRDHPDRVRVHPQRPPDRPQLLHRHDPGHGRDVASTGCCPSGSAASASGSTRRSTPTSSTSWPASR